MKTNPAQPTGPGKRSALLFLLLLMVTQLGFGQAVVDFRNGGVSFRTIADRKAYACGFTPLVGTNYVAALFYLPGADQGGLIWDRGTLAYGSNNLAYAYFRPFDTFQPGYWLNPLKVGNLRYLEGVEPGQTVTLQVRFWDITLAPDWPSAIETGQIMVSAPFNHHVPPAGSPPEAYYLENLRATAILGGNPGGGCRLPLVAKRTGDSVVVSWPHSYIIPVELETAPELAGPWTPLPGPYSIYNERPWDEHTQRAWVTNTASAVSRFYRLRTGQPFP